MDDFKKAMLSEDLAHYGIRTDFALLEAVCTMEKLDITQFLLQPGEKSDGEVERLRNGKI